MSLLQRGTVFEYYEGEPGRWRVERVGPSCALVRPLGVVKQEIYTRDGRWVSFNTHGRVVPISRNAMVRIVEQPAPKQAKVKTAKQQSKVKRKEKHK